MLCSRINKKHLIKLNGNILALAGRHRSTEAATSESGNAESAVAKRVTYPEILDLSPKERRKRQKIAWHEEVKKLNTIEEKLIKVNIPRYYGWQVMSMTDQRFAYNTLPYVQHYTRTQFEDGLPNEWKKHTAEELDAIVNGVKDQIEETISFHHTGYR